MENRMTGMQIVRFGHKLVEDEKSTATIQKYLRDIKAFFTFIDGKAVTKDIVIRYKQYLIEQYAPASVNSMLTAVNCFLKEMGWYDCIVKTLKVQRQAFRSKERELSKAEYYRLLEAAKAKNNMRLYLMMQTICSTGIRVSELKFITRSGKPIDRSNILHDMKALCQAAKVDRQKVFPHNLRHLFACLFYKVEKDLSRLADLLGHSNVNTTRIYTSVSGEEQVKQIERLGLVIQQKNKTA